MLVTHFCNSKQTLAIGIHIVKHFRTPIETHRMTIKQRWLNRTINSSTTANLLPNGPSETLSPRGLDHPGDLTPILHRVYDFTIQILPTTISLLLLRQLWYQVIILNMSLQLNHKGYEWNCTLAGYFIYWPTCGVRGSASWNGLLSSDSKPLSEPSCGII